MALAFCQSEQYLEHLIYIEEVESFGIYQKGEGYYKVMSSKDFYKQVFQFLVDKTERNLNESVIKSVTSVIQWTCYQSIESIMTDYLALEDSLLNLKTFEYEQHDLNKHAFYNLRTTRDKLEHADPPERFMQFLDEVLVHDDLTPDRELQTFFQEMMGYYLLNTNEAHVMCFLVGEGGNGKSVVLELLRHIIGKDFVSAASLRSLTTDKFSPANLIGKKINICEDDESKYIQSDLFKTLISGGTINVERKYQSAFTWEVKSKFIFSTNRQPTFSGLDEGLIRRVYIIPFKNNIPYSQRDTKLLNKLKQELPGIIKYFLDGAKRLVENNYKFSKTKAVDDAQKEFKQNISSAIHFFYENYEESPGAEMTNTDLYFHYKEWCDLRGKKPMNHYTFHADMNKALTLDSVRMWDGNEKKMVRGKQVKKITDQEPLPI